MSFQISALGSLTLAQRLWWKTCLSLSPTFKLYTFTKIVFLKVVWRIVWIENRNERSTLKKLDTFTQTTQNDSTRLLIRVLWLALFKALCMKTRWNKLPVMMIATNLRRKVLLLMRSCLQQLAKSTVWDLKVLSTAPYFTCFSNSKIKILRMSHGFVSSCRCSFQDNSQAEISTLRH